MFATGQGAAAMRISVSGRALGAVTVALACVALAGGRAHAQAQGLRLERSLPVAPAGRGDELPTFISAVRIEGLGGTEVEAVGNAEFRRGDTTLTADRIRYFGDTDEAEATGNVKIRIGDDEVTGPRLRLRVGDTTGIMDNPSFKIAPRFVQARERRGLPHGPRLTATDPRPQINVEGRGEAKAVRFEGEEDYRVTDGTFTTCKPGQDDWFIRAAEFDLDMEREIGTARDARMTFFGVTTPTIPWFNFSLNNERKSGFLPPAFGVQTKTGAQFMQPFYWNIAPNYDATIGARYMVQRGLQLVNEFRFLEPYYRGIVKYDILPEDKQLNETRWGGLVNANFNFQNGWYGLINYAKVSDDNYFRDLSGVLSIATQTVLNQQALVTYGSPSGWWSATANVQRFQVLQDQQNPVPIPYFREPQLLLNALKQTVGGLDAGFNGEYVNFRNPSLAPTGQRVTGYPSVSWPQVAAYGYVTPKIGAKAWGYSLTNLGTFTEQTPSVVLPVASVDTGLFFEREARWFGNDYLQTFEPRLYYLYVPFKNQANLPVFDTSTSDFNFSQLFQENIFAGGDRISNANQLSVAATSRFVRPTDGQEIVRAVIGQRYYFVDQKVFIPGQAVRTDSISPLIVGLTGRVAPNWIADVGAQYQFLHSGGFEKMVAGVRYSPAPASVASIAYRYTNQSQTAGAGTIQNIDLAAQWPLGRGFYGVGRYSYDIAGGKPVEALAGLEYNAGCWLVRAVAQRFQTTSQQVTSAFFIQIEFNGFARIGSNPLEVLQRSIPGYSIVNQSTPDNRTTDFGTFWSGGPPTESGASVTPIRSRAPGSYSTYGY
jgi:LPS-assembly protein